MSTVELSFATRVSSRSSSFIFGANPRTCVPEDPPGPISSPMRIKEVVDLERLREIVGRAGSHQPHGLVDVAVTRDEQERRHIGRTRRLSKHILAVEVGQPDVADDRLKPVVRDFPHRIPSALPPFHRHAFEGQAFERCFRP